MKNIILLFSISLLMSSSLFATLPMNRTCRDGYKNIFTPIQNYDEAERAKINQMLNSDLDKISLYSAHEKKVIQYQFKILKEILNAELITPTSDELRYRNFVSLGECINFTYKANEQGKIIIDESKYTGLFSEGWTLGLIHIKDGFLKTKFYAGSLYYLPDRGFRYPDIDTTLFRGPDCLKNQNRERSNFYNEAVSMAPFNYDTFQFQEIYFGDDSKIVEGSYLRISRDRTTLFYTLPVKDYINYLGEKYHRNMICSFGL